MNMVLPRYQQTFLGAEPAAIGMGRKSAGDYPLFSSSTTYMDIGKGNHQYEHLL